MNWHNNTLRVIGYTLQLLLGQVRPTIYLVQVIDNMIKSTSYITMIFERNATEGKHQVPICHILSEMVFKQLALVGVNVGISIKPHSQILKLLKLCYNKPRY